MTAPDRTAARPESGAVPAAVTAPGEEAALPIRFPADGLVPAVVQDAETRDVLMVGFMDRTALAATRATGRVHFWSRSRGKLWRKGETSGHEQIVAEIRVNCEQNSLLVLARQVGAVCHDGYPTCYYRRLEPDGTLTTVRERAFDPQVVYGNGSVTAPDSRAGEAGPDAEPPAGGGSSRDARLEEATRALFGAYAHLRDQDLAAVSSTSGRLRGAGGDLAPRVADELQELAGALDGSHVHHGRDQDVPLEAGQVLYWLMLVALRAGATWEQVRPDRALATADGAAGQGGEGRAGRAGPSAETVARVLRADAAAWALASPAGAVAARCHATIALVGQACRAASVDPLAVAEADLVELRTRPYLAAYFAGPADPPA